ncbi:MAG: OmpA family protein [Parachlamydiaceae bacterium]|nr:MAG: OmpA family protein [Parachlamydiaceae bacterium]
MKFTRYFMLFNLLLLLAFSAAGCTRTGDDIWDDTKTAGRHMGRGLKSLGGKHGDSRMVYSPNDFYTEDGSYITSSAPMGGDFIPLQDQPNGDDLAMADSISPQPRENPGDPGSSIPGIQAFHDPSTIPGLSKVFQNIRFDYNSNLIKGQQNMDILRNVADYMQRNPNTYVFIEGHTDERGAEAYNLALGSRRANAVRNALIADGVSPDNLFTISYGKERPAVRESHEEAWSQNRRAEFKIYQR